MFLKKKILILKNDRGGDLLNSLKCISSLIWSENSVTIILSQLNFSFSFLLKKANIIKTNYSLNFFIRPNQQTFPEKWNFTTGSRDVIKFSIKV